MKLQEALLLIGTHSQAAIRQVPPPSSRLDAEVSSPAEALQHAFLWRASREGYDFWAMLHRQLESGTLIPEPVAVIPEPVAVIPEPVVPTAPEPEPEPIYGLPNGAPPPPPTPDGYQWVYRGTGWESTNTTHCFLDVSGSWSEVYVNSNTNGLRRYHYLEAVPVPTAPEPEPERLASSSLSAPVPRNLLPLPELPEGFSQWVYRGTGWDSNDVAVHFQCKFVGYSVWSGAQTYYAVTSGLPTCHYIEAIREPLQCRVGRCYVQRDGVIRGELILTAENTSGVDNHPFFDGVFYRTPEGRLFPYDTFGSSTYIAEVEPQ